MCVIGCVHGCARGGVGWLLELYVLATSKVISGQLPICDTAHSWKPRRSALLGNRAAGAMTQYPSQSHYPATEQTMHLPIPLMPSARSGGDKYTLISYRVNMTGNQTPDLRHASLTEIYAESSQ